MSFHNTFLLFFSFSLYALIVMNLVFLFHVQFNHKSDLICKPVKIHLRQLIMSCLIWIYTGCPLVLNFPTIFENNRNSSSFGKHGNTPTCIHNGFMCYVLGWANS